MKATHYGDKKNRPAGTLCQPTVPQSKRTDEPRFVTCKRCSLKLERLAYSMGGLADALTPMPGLVGGKLATALEAMGRGGHFCPLCYRREMGPGTSHECPGEG